MMAHDTAAIGTASTAPMMPATIVPAVNATKITSG